MHIDGKIRQRSDDSRDFGAINELVIGRRHAAILAAAKPSAQDAHYGQLGLRPIPIGTMAEMEQYPQEWREYEPVQPRGTDWRGLFRKLWAPIAAIGAFLAKFGAVLLKAKFLFSMFVSAAVYVWLGGWG